MKQNKLKSALKIGNVSAMIKNQLIRTRFTFCILPDGSSHYWFNGLSLSKGELDLLYPIEPLIKHTKGVIPDARKKSIYF